MIEPIVGRDKAYERVFGSNWWMARCPSCQQIVSRYDFTEEEARASGREALERDHRCRGTK